MKIHEYMKDIIFVLLLVFNVIFIWLIVRDILDVLKENSKQIELIINHLNKKEANDKKD